ncbi:MAG: hypothetical protein FJZ01_15900 [Candidatus Sericytochromatia bacterium]|nr:hypothetical protein [Candidatus Tanganyikabacteria bacterium]
MADIPAAVLSDHFLARMRGRRLLGGVFLTYSLDPAFFEQEILPVFFDRAMSHAAKLRLAFLDDLLRSLPEGLAVYYDPGAAFESAESAKLDIRRIPVRVGSGVFHPKNVFLLVEDAADPDRGGPPARSLLVASLSANLTRSGWWENVEACHVEEIPDGARTRLRDPLLAFIDLLGDLTPAAPVPKAVVAVRDFLADRTIQAQQRSRAGIHHTHFHGGRESLIDFLDGTAGADLYGLNLEILSPFFDDHGQASPIHDLVARFAPREVRVFLPRDAEGRAECTEGFYESLASIAGLRFGELAGDIMAAGKARDAKPRHLHAKVYRFFSRSERREYLFVGSPNLTRPAFGRGGNVESGFFVDCQPARRPDFWLQVGEARPARFTVRAKPDEGPAEAAKRLEMRFHWDTKVAEVYWDDKRASGALEIWSQRVPLLSLAPVPARSWTALAPAQAATIESTLARTSFLTVVSGDGEALLLVQEEGMGHKPWLALDLTPAEILHYWSLLEPDRRQAFIERHGAELSLTEEGAAHVVAHRATQAEKTLFDRFAGFFHAFSCLEGALDDALAAGRENEAIYLLFGQRFDSLGHFLTLVADQSGTLDDTERYVIGLCARQVCLRVAERYRAFWTGHAAAVAALESQLARLAPVREALIGANADEMPEFLAWFDTWFMRRLEPVKGGAR